MEEEKATIQINQEFLQNHDVGEANADQPVETLQNKEEFEEDDYEDDDSSQEFASPIPVSNTQLSHPADIT